MRSCGTRSTKDHGPTHTGAVANLSPSLLTAAGETGMPDRSASVATSGEKALFSRSRIVSGSTTSTAVTGERELDRLRVHRGAVVELDAIAELDGDRLARVRDRGQRGGELGRDAE